MTLVLHSKCCGLVVAQYRVRSCNKYSLDIKLNMLFIFTGTLLLFPASKFILLLFLRYFQEIRRGQLIFLSGVDSSVVASAVLPLLPPPALATPVFLDFPIFSSARLICLVNRCHELPAESSLPSLS